MKFRKKPVVIEAVQWNGFGKVPVIPDVKQFDPYNEFGKPHLGWIQTLEGGHEVTPGDWIITGVKGEKYPCKPDIFAQTYEPAEGEGERERMLREVGEWLETRKYDIALVPHTVGYDILGEEVELLKSGHLPTDKVSE